jgi:hypothetical protein
MTRIRFATARALYETFPSDITRIETAPNDDPPLEFVKALMIKNRVSDAVSFCAHLLPRREAVWWGCESVRTLLGELPLRGSQCLQMAEAWVRDPDDERRLASLNAGKAASSSDPATWLALAVGWSGGFLDPQVAVPVPNYLTGRAVRLAIMLSAGKVTSGQPERLRACIGRAIHLAEVGI